jgi:IS66 C-terminal element/Transposase IS66 family
MTVCESSGSKQPLAGIPECRACGLDQQRSCALNARRGSSGAACARRRRTWGGTTGAADHSQDLRHREAGARRRDDGPVEVSNVKCENAIRPFVLGSQAWLFSDTLAAAHASAKLYSIVKTAKAARREPYEYLRHIFEKLPQAITLADIEALLPWNVAQPAPSRRSPPHCPSNGK